MLLLVLPLGMLPPLIAIALFDGLGLLCFGWAIRLAGIKDRLWIAMMVSPVVIYNFASNQNGAWFGAFLIAGLLLAEKRPVAAGFLLGLLTVKPQLCLLLPAYLLGRRNWRCLIAAGLTAVLLFAASILLFSFHSWVLFVSSVLPAMQTVLARAAVPHQNFMFITLFALARWAGLPVEWANIIQLIGTAAAMAAVYVIARQERFEPAVRWALVALLGVLATPYMQRYDMFGGDVCLWLVAAPGRAESAPSLGAGAALGAARIDALARLAATAPAGAIAGAVCNRIYPEK